MSRDSAREYALAQRSTPRYTSYPTAPHFTAAVDAKSYEAWLTALPRECWTVALHSRSLLRAARSDRGLCRTVGCGDPPVGSRSNAHKVRYVH